MPNTTDQRRLIRLQEVQNQTGLGRNAIYNRIKAGTFPPQIKLSSRVACWPADAIDKWIAEQIAASKASV